LGKTYRRFAYRKVYGIIGRYANNLGIKDRDFQISNKGIDQNNSDRTGISSVPTLLADMAVTVIGKIAMFLSSQKKEKLNTRW